MEINWIIQPTEMNACIANNASPIAMQIKQLFIGFKLNKQNESAKLIVLIKYAIKLRTRNSSCVQIPTPTLIK